MVIQKILVGCDFSEQADVAIAQAASIAKASGGELILCHVTQETTYPLPTKMEAEELAKAANRNTTALDKLAESLAARQITISQAIRTGYPDEGIVGAAAELGVDLIVTGTHGRTGLARFFLGSIAEKVVRLAQTNVLVARPSKAGDDRYRNILVPTDFSPASGKALRLAMELAAEGAKVRLFHAWHYPAGVQSTTLTGDNDPLAAVKAELVNEGRERGAKWVDDYRRDGVTLSFAQAYGPPSGAVNDELDRGGYDLVAMGTHGYRGFRRFILGSVAEATVRHAPCSVLVAHAKDVAAA